MPATATAAGATTYGIGVGGGTVVGMTAAQIAANVAMATAVASGYSYQQQSQFQKQQGEYQSQLARREAEETAEAGEHEERESRREARRLKEKQLVQFAKGGVVPSVGTPLKVVTKEQARYEADIGLEKYGYGIQRGRFLSRAQMEKRLGRSKSRASRYMAGTSLATGAYRTASLYARY